MHGCSWSDSGFRIQGADYHKAKVLSNGMYGDIGVCQWPQSQGFEHGHVWSDSGSGIKDAGYPVTALSTMPDTQAHAE